MYICSNNSNIGAFKHTLSGKNKIIYLSQNKVQEFIFIIKIRLTVHKAGSCFCAKIKFRLIVHKATFD